MITAIHACTMRRVLWACAVSILDSLRVLRRGASPLLVAAPAAMAGYLALATLSGILPVLRLQRAVVVVGHRQRQLVSKNRAPSILRRLPRSPLALRACV